MPDGIIGDLEFTKALHDFLEQHRDDPEAMDKFSCWRLFRMEQMIEQQCYQQKCACEIEFNAIKARQEAEVEDRKSSQKDLWWRWMKACPRWFLIPLFILIVSVITDLGFNIAAVD